MAEFEQTWSQVYLTIVNVQHQVQFQRQMDGDFNSPLEQLRDISQAISTIFYRFVQDFKAFGSDGQFVEYVLRFEILEQFVEMAIKNIPDGLLTHGINIFGALLVHLPNDAFRHGRIAAPLKRLLDASVLQVESLEPDVVLSFLEALLMRIREDERLLLMLGDCGDPMVSIFRHFLRRPDFLASQARGLLLETIAAGLIAGDDGAENCESLALDLIFRLVDAFCLGSNDDFNSYFRYIHEAAVAGASRTREESLVDFSMLLLSAFREHFINRIYSETLKNCSVSDRGLSELLCRLLLLLDSDEGTAESDLFVILISKTFRDLEHVNQQKPILDFLGGNGQISLARLYSEAILIPRLRGCLPTTSAQSWKESSCVHRARLELVFTLLSTQARLPCMQDLPMVSDFYKCHLRVLDEFLADGYEIRRGSAHLPDVKTDLPVLDKSRAHLLMSLYSAAKDRLSARTGEMSPRHLLTMVRFIVLVLPMLDTPDLYSEFAHDGPKPLVAAIQQAAGRMSEDGAPRINEVILEPLFRKHMRFDVFGEIDLTWEPSVLLDDSATVATYLVGHWLLRLGAILHTRAIRPPVSIFYE